MTRVLTAALFALLLSIGTVTAQTTATPTPAPSGTAARGQVSAEEMEMLRALQGGRVEGRVSIPDAQSSVLIQFEGKEWRDFHNRTLTWVGGIAVVGMVALLILFYGSKGRIPIEGGTAGRTMLRFSMIERANHWMVASSFIVLALSGLNLTFGRFILLPLIGPEAFTAVSLWGKIAHNYLAFPFTLGIILMFLFWVKDNIPNARDWGWVKAGGGFLPGGHPPPAGRFNAGQKMVFWITVLGGGLVAATGYLLMFPFAVTDIAGMQLSHIIHGVLAVLMIAAMLAHIYIGSVGMEGAFDAMGSGRVDYNWAKEHHGLWVEEEIARARKHAHTPANAGAAGAD